jgi:hypothetical protein
MTFAIVIASNTDLSTIKPSKLGTPAWLDWLGGLKQASLIVWLDWLDGQSVFEAIKIGGIGYIVTFFRVEFPNRC